MEATPPPSGVATAASAPAPSWPEPAQLLAPAGNPRLALPGAAPPVWPRSAQAATALLLVLALGLLAWHGYSRQRWGTRPTLLEPGDPSYRVDLNRADRAQLLQLPGVGDKLAGRIEAYRQEHSGFKSVDELRRVPGIGPALLKRLRPLAYVEPYDGEEEADPAPARDRPAARDGGEKRTPAHGKKGAPDRPIDVNRASAAELQRLPGIGPALSARIVAARKERPFASVDELRRVRGIGAKTLKRLRPYVRVDDPAQRKADGD